MLYIARLKIRGFKSFKFVDVSLPREYICLAGPNGSGKCVDGETEIYFADGTVRKIREIITEAMQNGHVDRLDDGYVAQYHNCKEILSLDQRTLKIEKKKISAFVKRKTPDKMLKVRTRSGREITATEYHPFFILDKDELRSIRADELKTGIRIAIPRIIPAEPNNNTISELLDLVNLNDNVYIPYNERTAAVILAKKGQRTWNDLSGLFGVPLTAIKSFAKDKQAIKFSYLVRILRLCGLNDFEVTQHISKIKADAGGEIASMPWQITDEFCKFLGYLLAEGSVSTSNNQIRFTNGREEIIREYAALVRRLFGLETHIYKYKKGSYDAIINCRALRNILVKLGMHYGGSGKKFIPEFLIEHSTNENLAQLLSGLYSGDGYVSKSSIEITLKSEKLIKTIERILLRLGMVPRIKRIIKKETKTGFVGAYFKISLFGTKNFEVFRENIVLTHEEKDQRIDTLLNKNINPNVDLIEANYLLKNAVKELNINIKKSRLHFPRIDAYCYNQCLPSRSGMKHVLTNLLEVVAVKNGIKSKALHALKVLSDSDVFWDEIEYIEPIKPKEEWVYDLSIDQHHNFIANGIFVHNSNFTDGIRFVLGESSLKSLRAKKVRDLIHAGGNAAEVTIYFEGDEKLELKRAIRQDGKILYKLNGNRTTRTAILEALKRHNLDESGRNIIAQGEVQRIINISAKERRQIIDSVAGISDFEDKKNEAMRELAQVDEKINNANLVLGEKNAFLTELEREKEVALLYMDSKKKLNNAKGTLLKRELTKLEKDLGANAELEKKLTYNIQGKEEEVNEVETKIKQTESMRMEVSKELQLKQKTSELIRKIEELKAAITSNKQMIEDRENALKKIEEETVGQEKEAKNAKEEIAHAEKELGNAKEKLRVLEAEAARFSSTSETKEIETLSKNIEEFSKKERTISEQLLRTESEIMAKSELKEVKKQELEALNVSLGITGENDRKNDKEKNSLKAELSSIAREIDQTFQQEKDLNAESANLDKKLLELREKYSVLRVQASPSLANPALKAIQDLRDKGEIEGIHGTVAELIKFETKYTSAVEAAAGNRLLYVVVKDADTATKIIRHLKKMGSGRATFIPLKEIKVSELPQTQTANLTLSSILKFSNEVKKAIGYVFGETLLMDNIDDAKRFGIGNARMVTLDGELFEKSGIISGGKVASSILATTQLAKIEQEINDVKDEKTKIMSELVSLREEASKKRAEKSEIELKIKTIEIQEKSEEEKLKANEKTVLRKKQIEKELDETGELIKQLVNNEHKSKNEREIIEKKLSELRMSFAELETKTRERADENTRKKTELTSKISSTRAMIDGKIKEIELRKNELFRKEEKIKMNETEKRDIVEKIKELRKSMLNEGEELAKNEEKISSTSKQIERLFETMKNYELDLQKFGEERAKIRIEIDKQNKELNQLNVKKAITETRLTDVKAEFGNYLEFEELESKKDELEEIVKTSETFLASLTNVNMAAIEMYDKKKSDIDQLRTNISTLDGEKNAIMQMMNEIDTRKKEAFFETFYAVSDNFRKMFERVQMGQGFLHLDNPNDPFQSGLHIKLRRNNRDHSIDSLSGGENSIVALMFIFSLQFVKPAPFYILDEVDSALDKENSKNLSQLIKNMAKDAQFIMVSHNDQLISMADAVLGVTRVAGVSKLVGVKLEQTVNAE